MSTGTSPQRCVVMLLFLQQCEHILLMWNRDFKNFKTFNYYDES